MTQVHVVLAAIVAALAVGVAVAAGVDRSGSGRAHLLLDRLILAALAAVLIAIVSGLLLLVTGHAPTDPLHLLYAGAALVALPIARFAVPALSPARRRWVVIAGAAILVGLVVRLLQTGD